MILVVGATGVLGLEVCRRLRGRDQAVRSTVRAGSSREEEHAMLGVDLVRGDLRSPESLQTGGRRCGGLILPSVPLPVDLSVRLRRTSRTERFSHA